MGGRRKDPMDVKVTIGVNIERRYYVEMEKEGKPKHVVERLIREKYAYLKRENVDEQNSDR